MTKFSLENWAASIDQPIAVDEAMRLAIEAGKKGFGFVSPNPAVGCVLVDKQHRLLSVGYHQAVGKAHAEAHAIQQLKSPHAAAGGTAYVTLEPCSHQGRTPPCAPQLVALGLAEVCYGVGDPNPLVAGKGLELLRVAKILVRSWKEKLNQESSAESDPGQSLLRDLENLSEIFCHGMTAGRPWVSLKVASSLDGKMALKSGESRWITGGEARGFSHQLRAQHDAVLIGRHTFETDDPALNVRLPEFESHSNHVVVIDPTGKTAGKLRNSQLFKVRPPEKIWIVCEALAAPLFADLGVKTLGARSGQSGAVDLKHVLEQLWQNSIRSVFVEGGAMTFGGFLRLGLVDRLHLFLAPTILGGQTGLGWSRFFGISDLSQRVEINLQPAQTFGRDLYLTGKINY